MQLNTEEPCFAFVQPGLNSHGLSSHWNETLRPWNAYEQYTAQLNSRPTAVDLTNKFSAYRVINVWDVLLAPDISTFFFLIIHLFWSDSCLYFRDFCHYLMTWKKKTVKNIMCLFLIWEFSKFLQHFYFMLGTLPIRKSNSKLFYFTN